MKIEDKVYVKNPILLNIITVLNNINVVQLHHIKIS